MSNEANEMQLSIDACQERMEEKHKKLKYGFENSKNKKSRKLEI